MVICIVHIVYLTFCASLFPKLPVTAAVSRTTPLAPQPRGTAQSRWTIQPGPQIYHKAPTPAQPGAPPRPVAPLTAVLPAVLSFALPDSSESSADGDERLHPEDLVLTAGLIEVPEGGARARDPPLLLVHRSSVTTSAAKSVPRGAAARGAAAQTSSCGDLSCHPWVPCEPTREGGLRCGTCPVGYIGDGRTCRGTDSPLSISCPFHFIKMCTCGSQVGLNRY